ncbi:hypothetical protein NH288_05385 [Anaerococcus sp. NML200537]|uniref:hypothetical protein n=1 Tax=Anaerococcus sp. NML200537 TaxID=2954485 RepID=UPI0022379CA1|nr:hypothetical protein [Anaerococcus sp. NML200537]MCW6701516.1 hypothetical protein [Anaerococcus sp. NML200537]
MNEQIIQKYVNLTSQKIYDSFYLETQLEEANKRISEDEKEMERLKKLLDNNNIDYNVNETKEEN